MNSTGVKITGTRRTTGILLVVLLLVCSLAGYPFWRQHTHANELRNARDGEPGETRLGLPFEIVEVMRAGIPKTGLVPTSNVSPEAPTGSPAGKQPEVKRYLRLTFASEDGKKLQHIAFEAYAFVGDTHSPSQPLQSGSDGDVVVSCAGSTTAVQTTTTDPIWHADVQNIALLGEYTEHAVVLSRLVAVEFDIRYEDGEPFVGRVSSRMGLALPSRTHNGQYITGGGFKVETNPCRVTNVYPRDEVFNFYVERAGYKQFDVDIKKEQLYEGARISLTILKPKNPPGSIIVHFNLDQFPKRVQQWRYKLTPDHYRGSEQSSLQNERPDSTFELHEIIPGGYTVAITCETRIWVVQLEVKASEETHVNADLAEPATASIRVIDETGNPLAGACIYQHERIHVDYPVQPQYGFRAAADMRGRVGLPGLSPSLARLFVEAQGYDVLAVSVALNPGLTSDLGTVRLTPSRGRIEVRLVNTQPGKAYEAMCIHPWGRGGNSTLVAVPSSGTVIFERMKMRDYLVAVHFAGGGKVVSKNVSISEQELELVVELDVGSLEQEGK